MTSTANPPPVEARDLDARDWLTILGLIVLTSVVFANGLRGEFVLDDQKQIVRNDLIRLPRFWPAALTRDIWAFQGERDTPWSNYWRPGHVAWLIVNYRLFGSQPFGWHLTNLLAHLGVVACAYALVRRLGATWGVATAVVAIFAVHPTRCESVTWLAGVHDVLATLWQFVALLLLMSLWRGEASGERVGALRKAVHWTAAVAVYALAVSTKEIAIFFPAIVALVRFTDPLLRTDGAAKPAWERLRRAVLPAVPFAIVGVMFLIARRLVLGSTQLRFAGQPGTMTVLASMPLVIIFYLRQIVFPYWVGWSYPVRVVSAANFNLWTFWLPLGALIMVGFVARQLVRGRLAIIGAALFVLTLLPALNLKALLPEQIVKDRYLYLPLLGFLMVVVPPLARWIGRVAGPGANAVRALLLAVAVALLSVRTVQYNTAWQSELALWRWAVWSDPTSGYNHQGLGNALMYEGSVAAAVEALDRAVAIHDWPEVRAARAEALLRLGRFDEAVADCQWILQRDPTYFRAYERLAIVYERQHRLAEAEQVLRRARERVPFRGAVFTDKLAVVLVKQGKRQEALAELESVRAAAETDFSPGSRMVLFHLGVLYDELRRPADAAAALRRFVELTDGTADPNLMEARQRARAILSRIR